MAALAIEYTPSTTILLGGSLGRKFGRKHRFLLDHGSVNEMIKAIDVNHPGFSRELSNAKRNGLEFVVFRNGKNVGQQDLHIGGSREIRLVPIISGSKRAGLLQTVIGVALIALAWWNPGAWWAAGVMGAGIASTAGGIIQMLSPQAKGLSQSASPENLPSYAFGSARNTTASGNPVPICIGRRRWGGAIISASIYAEDKA